MIRLKAGKAFLPWVGVAGITAIVVWPMFGSLPKGHDTLLHFYRIPEILSLWQRGVWFSRWSPDLVFGYGYPLFNFYPPLSAYLLTLAFLLTGGHAVLGMQLAFALALAGAVVGMFLLGRALYGPSGGLLSSAAYALSPHVVYQSYERGSLSNALAMALFPLAALAVMNAIRASSVRPHAFTVRQKGSRGSGPSLASVSDRLRPPLQAHGPAGASSYPELHRGRRWLWPAALAALLIAAAMLSHTAASLIFVAGLAVAAAASAAMSEGGPGRGRWAALGGALFGGLALSAFAWLPALAEIQFTQYRAAISAADASYTLYFADVFRWPPPAIDGLANPPLPLTVGLGQLGLGVLTLGLSVSRMIRRKGPLGLDGQVAIFCVMAFGAAYLASPPSAWAWERLSLLQNFQFPWRLLDVAAFWLALACGRLVDRASRATPWRTGAAVIGVVAFFAASLPYLYPPRWQALPDRPTLADASQAQLKFGIYGLTGWGEYGPLTAHFSPTAPAFPGADLAVPLDQKVDRGSLPGGALIGSSGGPTWAKLELDWPRPVSLTIDTFYFPGWAAEVDGVNAAIGPDERGLIRLTVPAGKHSVHVRFGSTPIRALADSLSIVTAGLIGLALVIPPRIREGRSPEGRPRASHGEAGMGRGWGRGAGRLLPREFHRQRPRLLTFKPASPPARPMGNGHESAPAEHSQNRPSGATLGMVALMVALALLKFVWLDHFDSPLVRRVQNGALPGMQRTSFRDFGGELTLLGHRLESADRLTLYWQAQVSPSENYAIQLSLVDARGVPVKTLLNPNPGKSAAAYWEPSQLVRDEYVLPLDQAQRPAGYRLAIAVIDPVSKAPLPLLDSPGASAEAGTIERLKVPPPADRPEETDQAVGAVFEGLVELARVRVPASVMEGEPANYTLFWKSLAPVSGDLTVFVHLLDQQGALVAGDDAPPLSGLYPTSFWDAGEVIADERSWTIPAPPGEYRLEVGLYRPGTGERLAITSGGSGGADNVILGNLTVLPAK